MIRHTALISLMLFSAAAILAQVIHSSDEAKKLHALFDEDWQWVLKQFPEVATFFGDNRYNDRLTDHSPEAYARYKAHAREMLDRIRKIDRAKLAGQDLISYDLFLRDKQINVEWSRFPTEYMAMDQMNGVQISFGQLAASTPFRNVKDYEDLLARLAAFPRQIDQVITLMRRGIETHWVQPAVPLRSLPSQIEGQIADDPANSPVYAPFKKFPQEVSEADRARLATLGKKAVNDSFTPAMKKLLAFVKNDYLPAARQEIGAASLPDGAAY